METPPYQHSKLINKRSCTFFIRWKWEIPKQCCPGYVCFLSSHIFHDLKNIAPSSIFNQCFQFFFSNSIRALSERFVRLPSLNCFSLSQYCLYLMFSFFKSGHVQASHVLSVVAHGTSALFLLLNVITFTPLENILIMSAWSVVEWSVAIGWI